MSTWYACVILIETGIIEIPGCDMANTHLLGNQPFFTRNNDTADCLHHNTTA